MRPFELCLYLVLLGLLTISSCKNITLITKKSAVDWSTPEIPNLNILSIDNLRLRNYGSEFVWLEEWQRKNTSYRSVIAAYMSDGLRVYARIDIPNKPPPEQGYPVVLFSHGWVGLDNAKDFDFFVDSESSQGQYLHALAEDGFVVITPGWRGHGTISGINADGIEFMQRWDNATYISPIFYAIDMLNALESIQSLTTSKWGHGSINIDLDKVSLSGHSQGGDSALLVLAIAGESSMVKQPISGASIFSGCFLPRLKQGELYSSMSMSPQAFLAGDGSWTSSASSYDGQVNPDFQFGFPADWIGTPNPSDWTWQNKMWSTSTVKQAFEKKYDEMYNTLQKNHLTADLYTLETNDMGRTVIQHPNHIQAAYAATSPIYYPQYLQEPLALHHSDRDYYSPSKWNQELVQTILKSGGSAVNFEYPGNTHSLSISQHKWFSENYNQTGLNQMIIHDINWFKNSKK
jgi:dienelactone hydrolase